MDSFWTPEALGTSLRRIFASKYGFGHFLSPKDVALFSSANYRNYYETVHNGTTFERCRTP